MKNIRLTLLVPVIMESVKTETLIKGRVDKATDDKAAALAFNEEAGDDLFHERKLTRTMHTSLSRLLSKIGDYLQNKSALSGENATYIENDGVVTIELEVSDRFNESFCDPLARLCSKFIEDHMLYLWWGTFNVKQAEFYKTLWQMDLEDILACFAKTAPAVPSFHYTEFIKTQVGHSVFVNEGEDFTLTYQLSDGCLDDIEVRWSNTSILKVKGKGDGEFYFDALHVGVCEVTLYSRHANKDCTVVIVVR